MTDDQEPRWMPAPEEQFVIDYDHATSMVRRITYRGVELPVVLGSLSVEQTWNDTTLTLTFKGDYYLVRWIDSLRDNIVDADPALRMLGDGR